MKIHEYQAKGLLKKYGVAVPKHRPCFTVEEVKQAAEELIKETGIPVVVVKAQIHAGGRGKGRFKEEPELGGVWKSNANLLTSAEIGTSDPLIGTWTYNGIPCQVCPQTNHGDG